MNTAACRGTDPELFFADDDQSIAEAKAICGDCPVRLDCLQNAIDTNQTHGIWGGLTRQERGAELVKRRQLAERAPATVSERRALVAYLSENLRSTEIAALIGVSVDVVKRDRQRSGAGPIRRGLTATGAEIYRLADAGIPRRVIAEQVQVSKRTVERWITRRREEVAA